MSRQVRVGILVFAGLALFLVALFAIASRSFLFSTTFPLEAEFENVAGLTSGAPVQYKGASAGRVEAIEYPDVVGGRFTVEMAVKDDLRALVNQETIAQIKSQSLVGGNMMIVLVDPSEQTLAERGLTREDLDPVEPGERIRGQEPFNIGETSDQLLATVDTFANVAVEAQQIMRDIQQGEGTLGRFLYDDQLYNRTVTTMEQAEATAAETQRLMTDLSGSVERITRSTEQATSAFQEIAGKINEGEGTLGRLLNDEAAYDRFLAAADTLVSSTQRIDNVLANAESATQWGALGAYRFAELMEAGKHNFLFKSYFEERGYMEKADFEIRESAIEDTYDDLEERRRMIEEREARREELEARIEELEARLQEAQNALPTATDGDEGGNATSDNAASDNAATDETESGGAASSAIGEAAGETADASEDGNR